MFGKKKPQESGRDPGKRKGADLMNQMGFGPIPGIGDMDGMDYGDDDDDLEAELAELAGEDYQPVKKPKPRSKGVTSIDHIEKMAASGLQDIDDDVSDTEDPDLLAELEDLDDDDDHISPQRSRSSQLSPTPAQPQRSGNTSSVTPPSQPQRSGNAFAAFPAYQPQTSPVSKPSSENVTPRASPSVQPPQPQAPSPKPSPGGSLTSVLEERMSLYKQAHAAAKTAGDGAKQRRLDRGIKTLADLLRQAKAGKPINEEEIPPPVALGASVAADSQGDKGSATTTNDSCGVTVHLHFLATSAEISSQSSTPSFSEQTGSKQMLEARRDEYKKAALLAKQSGDMAKAGNYVKISKQFDSVIKAVEEGKAVDLSKMPQSPPEISGASVQVTARPETVTPTQRSVQLEAGAEPELPTISAEQEKAIFNAPDAPKTVMEALTQRLEKYKSSETAAKNDGDSSKSRRMGRIVKQYEDAIKMYRAGKPVDFDELPVPPGFGPIPVDRPSASSAPVPAPRPNATDPKPAEPTARPVPPVVAAKPVPPTVAAKPVPPAVASKPLPQPSASVAPPIQRQNTARKSMHSRQEQQLSFLQERMGEFRQAAMNAKKNQDIELAKKYVRMMKGLEPMIEACESGLPVDLAQVPPSPIGIDDAEDKFVVVSAEDCTPTGDRDEVYENLKTDLIRQIQICVTNAQHYQKLGDVPAAAKFQKLEQNNRKDLESLKSSHRHGDPVPKFHYETRTFSMVQSNTELGDGDLELTIVRGIQYNLPSGFSEKDMDTCVKYEFAYPTEQPQTGSTATVKDTINPEYNESFKLEINRKSKGLFRFVERKTIKLEIYIKRGFFKGDKLLGTVHVKLQPLENQCSIHDSFDLVDGRKSVGGKLEVKVRIRDPFKNKQVDEVAEKWLVIDQFIRTAGSKSQIEAKAPKSTSDGTSCMEVLRYEKQLLDKQILQLKDSLSLSQTQVLKHKSAMIEEKIELQQKRLREGGRDAWKAYLDTVQAEVLSFHREAMQFAKLGDKQKAEVYLTKKKFAEKELAAIKAKFNT
ncbi:coiled-coil and C2 domain-containing protein 1-like [Physella acuta]|uniref:coiled-coil and C2 domain-containing protein 1-like n=1 Tax=Physella acuta TaxID=109671 RepID=UPI0027DD1652|nr:coiled-coil and C2 domain-containing protein 1-like [Physella acuta]